MTSRGDVYVPLLHNRYLQERVTEFDTFLRSGAAVNIEALNGFSRGGYHMDLPAWNPNLPGTGEQLDDTTDWEMTPESHGATFQCAVAVHRGNLYKNFDLASLGSGEDNVSAIINLTAPKIAHVRQRNLLSTLNGLFGALDDTTGASYASLAIDGAALDTPTQLGLSQVIDGEMILRPDEMSSPPAVLLMTHTLVYAGLKKGGLLEFVPTSQLQVTASDAGVQSTANVGMRTPEMTAFLAGTGIRVERSQDAPTDGTNYGSYLFTQGAIGFGNQRADLIEQDRNIAAPADLINYTTHFVYHPMGAQWQKPVLANPNPSEANLADITNWAKVYEDQNCGVVRITSIL